MVSYSGKGNYRYALKVRVCHVNDYCGFMQLHPLGLSGIWSAEGEKKGNQRHRNVDELAIACGAHQPFGGVLL
ncbi:hypothetical protein KCP76_20500 [Salmonella enterica subsp. enterica serovar Weltevreden]|nr:hypothetical protein KCP76_20500 [Salmonella enterica subsp. enterica serovar Weltevreden]